MPDGTYITPFVGTPNLEVYHSRPKNKYNNPNTGLKRLVPMTDVHFDRATVNYIGKLLAPDPALSSWSVHTTSSNSAYAFAIGQIMLSRNILHSLPITPTSSMTAFNLIFRLSTTAQDITNDPGLGLGKIGVITLKKEKYGDYIRANTLTAITNSNIVLKDAGSASTLHGIMVQQGPGYVALTGSSLDYWAVADAWSAYSSGIMFSDGLNDAYNSYFDLGSTAGWSAYNNPQFQINNSVFTWDTGSYWASMTGYSDDFSGIGVTATMTSNKLYCHVYSRTLTGPMSGVAIVIQTPSTSLTSFTNKVGLGVDQQVVNFVTPTTGTVTAWMMCRGGGSANFNALEIREQVDWTMHTWIKHPSLATAYEYVVSKQQDLTVDSGWSIRTNQAGANVSQIQFWFLDKFGASTMQSSVFVNDDILSPVL